MEKIQLSKKRMWVFHGQLLTLAKLSRNHPVENRERLKKRVVVGKDTVSMIHWILMKSIEEALKMAWKRKSII